MSSPLRWMPGWLLCASLVVLAASCSIHVGTTHPPDDHPPHEDPRSATQLEIDAAAAQNFPQDRAERLVRIARRPHLTSAEQIQLSAYALDEPFPHQQEEILVALIGNPGFCEPAKKFILRNLERCQMSQTRQAVLDAMDQAYAHTVPVAGTP